MAKLQFRNEETRGIHIGNGELVVQELVRGTY